MSKLFNLFLLSAATFGSSFSLLLDDTCQRTLQAAYTGACDPLFRDIRALGNSLSSLQSTVSALQRDVDLLSVRLVNGTAYSGVVEIFQNGFWGAVCDEHWDQADANVVCNMLGYARAWSTSTHHITSSPYFTSNMNCNGTEDSIFKCSRMSSNLNFGCDYNRAAGVDCVMGIRLTGSTLNDRGRVEVQHLGEWGTICDPQWTSNDAEVVCRMLGRTGGRAVSGATFGAGTGRVLLSNVLCTGNEKHLMQCRHVPFRLHSCDHSQDVSVVCDS